MKRLTEFAIILLMFTVSSWAQEFRHEVTVQGSGFFQKQTTKDGITNDPANSGGVTAGYRLNLKNWLATMTTSETTRAFNRATAARFYR